MLDAYMDVVLFFAFITLLLIFLFSRTSNNGSLNLPGPVGLPLIGCYNKIDRLNLHRTLDEWAYKYGDMYRCSILGRTFLVLNSSRHAREMYLEEPAATLSSGRYPIFACIYIMEDANIIHSSISESWKHRRKITHRLLRAYGEGLKQMEGTLMKSLQEMAKGFAKLHDTTIDPISIVEDFLLRNLEILITGHNDSEGVRNTILELDELLNQNLLHPGRSFLLTRMPWIRFLPCQLARNIQRFLKRREEFFHMLDDSIKKDPDSVGIYQKLLSILQEEEKSDNKIKITMKNVQMIVVDLITAGFLTTRGTLMSIIKILMSRRDVQTKMQNEIDTVIGRDRNPTLSDRKNCPFIEATILESLRYISHAPLTLHQAIDDFQFHEIRVPKGCTIILNAWHMHHSEKEWTDPFMFRPERFLDDDGNLIPANEEIQKRLLVFGIGKRACIGEVFAKSRIFLFLATLLQQFVITTPNNDDLPIFHPKDMKPGAVLNPTDYMCRIVQRQNISTVPV